MKIRSMEFEDFRCFRGRHHISFVDELTDKPRDLTVIIGSNGSGKTSILEAIEGLLWYSITGGGGWRKHFKGGEDAKILATTIEVSEVELGGPDRRPEKLTIAICERSVAGDFCRNLGEHLLHIKEGNKGDLDTVPTGLWSAYKESAAPLLRSETEVSAGGLVFFPHNRYVAPHDRGPIQQPARKVEGLFRYRPPQRWSGSLEQLWVWENYLDLESGDAARPRLGEALELAADVLGHDRTVSVREGRVYVSTPDGREVGIHDLPSGEQQILLLFGELAHQRRPQAVLVIDEPEISLHPALQRQMLGALRRFAKRYDNQIILATHSPEIVRAVKPHEVIDLDRLETPSRPHRAEDKVHA